LIQSIIRTIISLGSWWTLTISFMISYYNYLVLLELELKLIAADSPPLAKALK